MWTKAKKTILAIELVALIILSAFLASLLANRIENKPNNNLTIGGNENTIQSHEDNTPEVIPESQQELSSDYFSVDFTWSPEYPDVGEKITFRSNGLCFGESWNFGDGSRGLGPVVTHAYDKKDEYKVILTAHGRDYSSGDIETVNVVRYIIIGASPFPKFTWSPNNPAPGQSINFDASESWDTNGQIVSYNWSYTDASLPNKVIALGNNKIFTFTWDKQGNYRVKLAVTDDENNTNEITKTIIVSILKLEAVTGGFRNLDFQITNRGNITASNIQWKVYVERNFLIIPLWKIFSKTGTINTLKPDESTSVDIGSYRRGFGRVTITITVETNNGVKITKSLQGYMIGKYVHVRS